MLRVKDFPMKSIDIFRRNIDLGRSFDRASFIFTRKKGKSSRDNVRIGLNDFSSKLTQTLNNRNYLTFKFSHLKENSLVERRLTFNIFGTKRSRISLKPSTKSISEWFVQCLSHKIFSSASLIDFC